MSTRVTQILIIILLLYNGGFWSVADAEEQQVSLYNQVIAKLERLNPGTSIDVIMATEKERYEIGEPFELRFQLSEDCYVIIMHIAADGEIAFLVPNVSTIDHKVEGKRIYSTLQDFNLPIKASSPQGIEVINLFCSPKKFDLFQADFKQTPFYTITREDEQRLKDLLARLDKLENAEWSGTSVQFRVGPEPPLLNVTSRSSTTSPSKKIGAIIPPIATTGTSGKKALFPPIGTTGTTGHSESPLGTD